MNRKHNFNKVFGIGVQKTGTCSLYAALNILGIKCSHWKDHNQLYKGIVNNCFKYKLLEEYDAICDMPIPSIYKELDREYPGSKFVLTIRDVDSWFKSLKNHHYRRCIRFKSEEITLNKEEKLFYGIDKFDKDIIIEKYKQHNKEVIEYFKNRSEDLLIMNLSEGDGWEKLCPFLHKEKPNEKFPWLNNRSEHIHLLDNEDLVMYGAFDELIRRHIGFDDRIKLLKKKENLLTLKENDSVSPLIVIINHKPDTIHNVPKLCFQKRLNKPNTIIHFSLPSYVKRVYAGVCNVVNDDRFCSIPRGIFNPKHNLQIMKDVKNKNYNKNNLVYANFRPSTNHFRKILLNNIIPQRPFIKFDLISKNLANMRGKIKHNKCPELMKSYYTNIAKSKFCFCPEGHDVGSFRLWETLYLNTIPIVSNFPYYQSLKQHIPLLILDDYSIITEKFLEEKYDEIISQKYTSNYLKCDYWVNKITSDLESL